MGPAPHPSRWVLISHWQCEGDAGAPRTPSSPFLWGQRNGLETQRKPWGPGCCCQLGSYKIIAGITFGRVVDGKDWCVHLAWPLLALISLVLRPTVSRKAVGHKCNYIYQSKRPSEVDAPVLPIHHPTKSYTSTIKQTHQANSNHQAPKAFFGSLARFFGPKEMG